MQFCMYLDKPVQQNSTLMPFKLILVIHVVGVGHVFRLKLIEIIKNVISVLSNHEGIVQVLCIKVVPKNGAGSLGNMHIFFYCVLASGCSLHGGFVFIIFFIILSASFQRWSRRRHAWLELNRLRFGLEFKGLRLGLELNRLELGLAIFCCCFSCCCTALGVNWL